MIRIWDPRKEGGAAVSLKLSSHSLWVSSVTWSPVAGHLLLSSSYDQSVKMWDLRSTTPLYTIRPEGIGKVFDVDWSSEGLISFGGESSNVFIYSNNKSSSDSTINANKEE
jgi:ribosome biogenesis protein YTM1